MSISRRDFLKLSGTMLGAISMPAWLRNVSVNPGETSFATKFSGLPPMGSFTSAISIIQTRKPQFYLTIDDGWHPDVLQSMLDLLNAKDRKATFFLVGNAAEVCDKEKKGLIRRVVEEGHDIGYHTVTHRRASQLAKNSTAWFIEDYRKWTEIIRRLVGSGLPGHGIKPVARAPGGYFSPTFLGMCNQLGLIPVGWKHTTETVARGQKIHQGDILLMHVTEADNKLLEGYLDDLSAIADPGLAPAPLDMHPDEELPHKGSPTRSVMRAR
jgi:peptidoglycan/xylan/chitin deacetylase (PgdA/CDA1 family)